MELAYSAGLRKGPTLDISRNKTPITSRHTIHAMILMNDQVSIQCKARLVACGYTQREAIDLKRAFCSSDQFYDFHFVCAPYWAVSQANG